MDSDSESALPAERFLASEVIPHQPECDVSLYFAEEAATAAEIAKSRDWFANYCRMRGVSAKSLADNVSKIYDAGRYVPHRQVLRELLERDLDGMARDLDTPIPDVKHEKLWPFVAAVAGAGSTNRTRYSSGETDPDSNYITKTLSHIKYIRSVANIDKLSDYNQYRSAVAYSLTCMRVTPPTDPQQDNEIARRSEHGDELRACWKHVRQHRHYLNTKQGINLHCLDEVGRHFPNLMYQVDRIVELRQSILIDASGETENRWFAFRYITETLYGKPELWKPGLPLYRHIWQEGQP